MSESGLYSEESDSDDSLSYQDDNDSSYDYTGEEDSDSDQESNEYNEYNEYNDYSDSETVLESKPLHEGGDGWQNCERGEGGSEPSLMRKPQSLLLRRGPACMDLFFIFIVFITAIVVAYYYVA